MKNIIELLNAIINLSIIILFFKILIDNIVFKYIFGSNYIETKAILTSYDKRFFKRKFDVISNSYIELYSYHRIFNYIVDGVEYQNIEHIGKSGSLFYKSNIGTELKVIYNKDKPTDSFIINKSKFDIVAFVSLLILKIWLHCFIIYDIISM